MIVTDKLTGHDKITLTRTDIFHLSKNHLFDSNAVVFDKIEKGIAEKYGQHMLSVNDKDYLGKLLYKFRTKWKNANRTYDKFLVKNESWLAVDVTLSNAAIMNKKFGESSTEHKMGRPSSSFSDSSDRTKRRKTQKLREDHGTDELAYATEMSFRASGKYDAAKVIKDIAQRSPTMASRYRESLEHAHEQQMSPEVALSLLIENNLSKSRYNNIRATSLDHNSVLYPPYHQVSKAKEQCYPRRDEIFIDECKAEVKLQALLDHTAERILLSQKDVIKSISVDAVRELELMCKWGCDGTSGQSTFKQKFNDNEGTKTDANIFFTSLVPLQLHTFDESKNKIIIWKNPRPSSHRFCRPIKLQFLHETASTTRDEVHFIKEQERNLETLQTTVDGNQLSVSYKLSLTMIDGKVCNSVTDTSSSQRCYLCQCTSKEFNDIDKVLKKEINEDNLEYGVSSLHAWIRLFECLLHISYKLDTKKWQNRGVDKESIATRKKNIQSSFRQQLGLLVDQPKQGYGSTNDGNTARRFFENASISAMITGVDETLINKFYIILQVLSCGFEIDVKKYEEYCLESARLFVLLYPWYYMPTTVHKVLIHSPKIIERSLLPIGQMSEEAQEACNKFIKKNRQDFARKCSRIKNMEDVFLRLMVASDPLITSLRKLPAKKMKSLSPEAIQLLTAPKFDHSILTNSTINK